MGAGILTLIPLCCPPAEVAFQQLPFEVAQLWTLCQTHRPNKARQQVDGRSFACGDQLKPILSSRTSLIEKLIAEFGQDTETIAGTDVASRIVKAIRRIAQLRRRLEEVRSELEALSQAEFHRLKQTIEEAEVRGDDPLGDSADRLQLELSARRLDLFTAQQECA